MLLLPVGLVAVPLLCAAVALWIWLRRTNRAHASTPFVGMAISGAVSFLSMVGAVGLLIAIAAKDKRQPDFFDHRPLLPLTMIGLFLLALATAFLGAVFAVWMFWRV